MDVGINDVANGLRRQRPKRREHFVAHLGQTRVNQRDPFRKYERGDVSAAAGEHIEVLAHLRDVDVAGRARLISTLRRADKGREPKQQGTRQNAEQAQPALLQCHGCPPPSPIRGRVLAGGGSCFSFFR